MSLPLLHGRWEKIAPKEEGMTLDTFEFYADGNFLFERSRFDCENRIRDQHGMWNVSGNRLQLFFQKRIFWSGGFFIPNEGNCITSLELTEYVETLESIRETLSFGLVIVNDDEIEIGGQRYKRLIEPNEKNELANIVGLFDDIVSRNNLVHYVER